MSDNKECCDAMDIQKMRNILDTEIDNTINKLIKIKKKFSSNDYNINVLVLDGFISHFYDIQALIKEINSDIKLYDQFNKEENKEKEEIILNKRDDEK